MNCLTALLLLILVGMAIFACLTRETFQLDHYLRRNYESGSNMLRGDLSIAPVQQSWFNTRYGPSSFVRGWF